MCLVDFMHIGQKKQIICVNFQIHHNRFQWMWQSIYGPPEDFNRLFWIKGEKLIEPRLGFYSNWDADNDQPDNLLGKENFLAICNKPNKKWSDEDVHKRLPYLIEYNGIAPNPARIVQVNALNGGIRVIFSVPLFDGGSPIHTCRVSAHPEKMYENRY